MVCDRRGVLFSGFVLLAEGEGVGEGGDVGAHFNFVDKDPCLLAGADVPVGQGTVVVGFDLDVARADIGTVAGEGVLHALFLALKGGGELFVLDGAPEGVVLAVVGHADFHFLGEEDPAAHVLQTVDAYAADGFLLQEVDDHLHVLLPALPAADAVVGGAIEAVDEAYGAVLEVLGLGLGDVAEAFVGDEALELLGDHGAVAGEAVVGYGAQGDVAVDGDGPSVAEGVGVGGGTIECVVDSSGALDVGVDKDFDIGGVLEAGLPIAEVGSGGAVLLLGEEAVGGVEERTVAPEHAGLPVVLSDDDILGIVVAVDGYFVEHGGCGDVFAAAGAHGVESHGRHDIPGAHLAAVFVAAEAVGYWGVELVTNFGNQFVELVGGAEVCVEVGGMVRGLVAVGILADEAGDVALLAACGLAAGVEERVEEGLGLGLAAHALNPCGDIVGHVGAGLPGVGLGVVVVDLGGVEGGDEASVAAGMHEAVGVHDVLPGVGAAHIGLGNLGVVVAGAVGKGLVAAGLVEGEGGDAPVVVGIFKSLGDRLVVLLAVEIALGGIVLVGFGAVGGGHHGLEQLQAAGGGPLVEDASLLSLKDYGACVVAYHAVGLVGREFPHGEFAALLELGEHGVNPLLSDARLDDGHEGVEGTVGVPE